MRLLTCLLLSIVAVPGAAATVLLDVDLDDRPLGPYSVAEMEADWLSPSWDNGVSENRVAVVADPAGAGRSLRVTYPEGGVGSKAGGAQWKSAFGRGHDEAYVRYRVRFAEGFDFVKGGKLPGLAGGDANSGGSIPDGTDGWSARMMWRAGGKVVQYVYHLDQPTSNGQDFAWNVGGVQRVFRPGVWHTVEHRVVMNTPGRADGRIQGWFDGALALDVAGLRFRTVSGLAIDLFFFSTFFGGSGSEWAPTKDEHVLFDDVVVSTGPIGLPGGGDAMPVRINFQPAQAPVPAGWLADASAPFGPRGGGLSFGWTSAFDDTRDRNAASAPDQRFDTLNHLQKGGVAKVWELALPDGTYDVRILSGDPAYVDQINHLDVEGALLRDPDGYDHFDEAEVRVEVRDGRLTVRPGPGASNAKICSVEVHAVVIAGG